MRFCPPKIAFRLLAVQLSSFLISVDAFSPQNELRRVHSPRLLPLPKTMNSNSLGLFPVATAAAVTDMTVSQANDLAAPFLMASAIPGVAFCYLLNLVPDCPKGVVFGVTLVMLVGATAYPTELYTQSAYGVSFFDCDWVHGPISFLFAMSYFSVNFSFVNALKQGQNTRTDSSHDDCDYKRALADCASYARPVLLTSMVVMALVAVHSTQAAQVHTPWLFSNQLDLPIQNIEPTNALTIESWASHISELTQYQMIMSMIMRWARQSGNLNWKNVAWGLFPLQVGNVAIVGFHFLYNQAPVLLLSFGVLMLLGYSTAAFSVFQLLESGKYGSIQEALPTMATESSNLLLSELETDSPILSYGLKWIGCCILASIGIKYGSLLIDLPGNLNTGVGLAMILLPFVSGLLLLQLLSLDSKLGGDNALQSTKSTSS